MVLTRSLLELQASLPDLPTGSSHVKNLVVARTFAEVWEHFGGVGGGGVVMTMLPIHAQNTGIYSVFFPLHNMLHEDV